MDRQKWVIYTRCSTEEQATEGYSIEMQKNACKNIIGSKPNAELYKIYSDEGLSGSDSYTKRKELLKLLSDVKNNDIHGLVLYRADRLTRLSNEQEQLIHLLIKYGLKEIVCYSGENLSDNSPQGEFMRRTWANLNELEVKVLSFRIKSAMQTKVENGEWKGGRPPYGFLWDSENKKMIPEKEKVRQIRKIYNLYVNEMKGLGSIRDILNNDNDLYIESNGTTTIWTRERILGAVKSPVYCGYQYHNTRYGKFDIQGENKKLKEKSEWELYKGKFVEPIISKEMWDNAQRIRELRGRKVIQSIPNKTSWLLSGLLYCGCCGERFLGHPHINKRKLKDGTIREYDCSSYICWGKGNYGKGYCNTKQIVRRKIDRVIEDATLNYFTMILNKLELSIQEEKINELIKEESVVDYDEVRENKKQIREIDKKIQKYYNDYENELITADVLTPAIKRLNSEKQKYQGKLNKINKELNKDSDVFNEMKKYHSKLQEWFEKYKMLDSDNIEQKKLILYELISYIEIIPGKNKEEDRVSIVFKISDSMFKVCDPLQRNTHNIYASLSKNTKKILNRIITSSEKQQRQQT